MKIKLNLYDLNKITAGLADTDDSDAAGTGGCGCGCLYAGSGGSSWEDNAIANADLGISTPYPGYPVPLG